MTTVTDMTSLMVHALIRPFNPETSFFGPTKFPQGFAVNFRGLQDIDQSHSVNYFFQGGYDVITPTRKRGGEYLSETFTGLPGWSPIATGSAQVGIINTPNFDADHSTLRLYSGGVNGSVAGVTKSMGAVPDDFSFMILPWFTVIGHYFESAAEVIVQNNAGRALWTRYWAGHVQAFMDGQWFDASTHCADFLPTETWWLANYQGAGQHKLALYQGTEKKWERTGALASVGPNNSIAIKQQSVAENNRECWIAQVNVGVTQLPDDMTICSNLAPYPIPVPPTIGRLLVIVEDVSNDLVAGVNFSARISRDNCGTWANVPLTEMANCGSPFLYGRLDNSKPNRVFIGEAAFCGAVDTKVRWALDSSGGCLAVMGGVVMEWS